MGRLHRYFQHPPDTPALKRAAAVLVGLAILVLAPGVSLATTIILDPIPAIDDVIDAGYNNVSSSDMTLGWSFDVDSDILIKKLGVWDDLDDGLDAAHQVGIWNDAGDLLVSTTVQSGTASPTEGPVVAGGQFRYEAIEFVDQVVLSAGETYVIGALFDDDDDFIWDGSSMSTASEIIFGEQLYADGNGFELPENPFPSPRYGYFGPNFMFVPEPSSGVLLALGLIAFAVSKRTHRP